MSSMMKKTLSSLTVAAALSAAVLCSAPAAQAVTEETVAMDAATREQLAFCTDGKAHVIAIAPHATLGHELFYGDGKRLVRVGWQPPARTVTGTSFLDPRKFRAGSNPDFRGLDMRLYSEVEYDAEKKTCAVRCGEKTTALSVIEGAKAKDLAKSATFLPSPQKYKPHALARDNNGVYYYVERGAASQNERSFRLYVGTKGAMQLQKMTNVVSDSEGEIFATPNGSLRMVLDRKESLWIENEKQRPLKVVPWDQNLAMIYNELGIYAGQRLGTPCDDL